MLTLLSETSAAPAMRRALRAMIAAVGFVALSGAAVPVAAQSTTSDPAPVGAPPSDAPTPEGAADDLDVLYLSDAEVEAIRRGLATTTKALAAMRERFESDATAPLDALALEVSAIRPDLEAARDRLSGADSALRAALARSDSASAAQRAAAGGEGAEAQPADEAALMGPPSPTAAAPLSDAERDQVLARLAAIEPAAAASRDAVSELERLAADIAERRRLNEARSGVDARRAELEGVRLALSEDAEDPDAEEPDYVALRETLRELRARGQEAIRPLKERRDEFRADLDRLGPAPEDDQPAEADEIAAERAALTAALVKEDAIVRQSDLNLAEIDRLLEDIDERRREEFYSQILRRSASPLQLATLARAAETFLAGVDRLSANVGGWRERKDAEGGLWRAYAVIALSLVVSLLLFGPIRRWANRSIIHRLQASEPTQGARAGVAIVRILARAVPGVIAGGLVYEALLVQGLIPDYATPFARSIWFGFLALLSADAGVVAVFAPQTPGWRLVPLATRGVRIVRAALLTTVFLYFADRSLTEGAKIYGGDQELALVQSAVVAIAMAIVFLVLAQKSVWRLAEGRGEAFGEDVRTLWNALRRLLRVIAVAIIAAAAVGYVALAHYLATRVFMLDGIIAAGLFIRIMSHQALRSADAALNARPVASEDGPAQERLVLFWVGAILDLVIILALTPFIFLALGAEWEDVRNWIGDAFFGFQIGGVTISFAQIFVAIGIFVFILTFTKFVQRIGEKRFFPHTRLDVGVQNSLKTLIGYVGLVIAFMVGASVLGFNLSNLAIIAGALSVGIGFGLQSIVNNFVSGLILLFERPIKVGDWIVTPSGEGIVKRISVRATEIETFDRASVIVPNSELISSAVTNWTHKNKTGRVIIPVGVSYESDPEEIIRLLEEVARDTHLMLAYPPPYVYFVGFGDSSLDFELRGLIRDVNSSLSTKTALRVAVFKKLQEAGVEIPFPQRDLHLRSGAPPQAALREPEGNATASPSAPSVSGATIPEGMD